jgi:hypothetical protein
MMRFAVGVLLAVSAAACAFFSEAPFFDDAEGGSPIDDGAQFIYREVSVSPRSLTLTFSRAGARYDVDLGIAGEKPFKDALLVPIQHTPELDYILQWQPDPDSDYVTYSFVWRTNDGYRLVGAPRALDDTRFATMTLRGLQRVCTEVRYRGCRFDSREALMAFYSDHIYSRFVAGNDTPTQYADLTPVLSQ